MKQTSKIAGAVIVLFAMSIAEMPHLSVILVPEAQAFRGRGAAFVVGAAVGSAGSSSAQASAAASQQQAAAAQQQAATAQQQATIEKEKAAAAQQQTTAAQQQAAAAQQEAAAAGAGKSLPVGTVVSTLPAGCTPKTVGGVQYHACGDNFYRAAFQGSTLVYVTAQP